MDITLTLTAAATLDEETLERHTFEVLDAVERHGPATALGAVVAADFATNSVELVFSVATDSLGEAQAVTAKVLKAIEKHTAVNFNSAGTCTTEPDGEHAEDLALTC